MLPDMNDFACPNGCKGLPSISNAHIRCQQCGAQDELSGANRAQVIVPFEWYKKEENNGNATN
jgi:hypothetical protein